MLRVLIVDDELAAIRAMVRLLAEHQGIEIVGVATTAQQARDLLDKVRPDAVLLDIELGEKTGFDLLTGPNRPQSVVFVTAHPVHAVEAFAADAVDFLVKPVDPGRLAEAVRRLERRQMTALDTAPIPLRLPGRIHLVPPQDITALHAEGDFARVRFADGSFVLIHGTLSHFEALLPCPPFLRLDRSLILNTSRVRRLVMRDRNSCVVDLEGQGEPVVLGRTGFARLRAALTAQTVEKAGA